MSPLLASAIFFATLVLIVTTAFAIGLLILRWSSTRARRAARATPASTSILRHHGRRPPRWLEALARAFDRV